MERPAGCLSNVIPAFIAAALPYLYPVYKNISVLYPQNLDVLLASELSALENRALARHLGKSFEAVTTPSSAHFEAKNKASPTTFFSLDIFIPCPAVTFRFFLQTTTLLPQPQAPVSCHTSSTSIQTARLLPNCSHLSPFLYK